jgi:Reverse transcriptase (RNA-dependent DNA polymerase)
MRQPEGFEVQNPDGRKWVCKLKKGLYGLKQSRRLWYQKLADELEHIGFTQLQSDPSIYVWAKDGVRVTLPVFVNDITITSKSKPKIDWVKMSLAKVFKLKDLSPTTYLLGIKVEYDRENKILCLSQTQYIIDMLACFRLSECRPVTTPMEPGITLDQSQYPSTEEEIEEMKKVPYMNAIGALMYLAIGTCPDIAYSVTKLAQFNSNPGLAHWKAVKHLFRYLKGQKILSSLTKRLEIVRTRLRSFRLTVTQTMEDVLTHASQRAVLL